MPDKVAGLRPVNFTKCLTTPFDTHQLRWLLPVKFTKFLKTAILKNICERLLLSLFKKRLQHRCFPVNFMNYSRRIYIKELSRTAASKTPVWGFLFNEVASLMAWRPLPVLERNSSTGIFL